MISAESPLEWSTLPYASSLVNTIVVENISALLKSGLLPSEIARVLVPGGQLIVGNADAPFNFSDLKEQFRKEGLDQTSASSEDNQWMALAKSAATTIDDWTHWDKGPEGNPLSYDTKVAPPSHLKWSSGDEHVLAKANGSNGFRIKNGIAYYTHLDARSGMDRSTIPIVARDASNGTKIWQRSDVYKGQSYERSFDLPTTVDDNYLYTMVKPGGATVALDARTGITHMTYTAIAPEWTPPVHVTELTVIDGKLIVWSGRKMHVINPKTGSVYWSKDAGTGAFFFGGIASLEANKVFSIITTDLKAGGRWPFCLTHREIVCYNLTTGAQEWSTSALGKYAIGQLIYYKGTLGFFGSQAIIGGPSESCAIGMMDPLNGKVKWVNQYGAIISKVPWHDSRMGGLSMVMRGNQAIVNYGPNVIFWDILTGGYRFWRFDLAQTGEVPKDAGQAKVWGLHACVKGVASVNYVTTGLGIWIDNSMKYDFLPIRRAGCAAPGFLANGLIYWAPATCACIDELNGGKGFVALGNEGRMVFAPDRIRLVETVDKNWKVSGGTFTSVLRKSATANVLQPSLSPIVSDWPEYRHYDGLAKRAAVQTVSSDGYTVRTTGSLLGVEISTSGSQEPPAVFLTGGRVSAQPIVYKGLALIGSHDGYVYAYDLKEKALKWKFMATLCDQRIIFSSQLESTWPVVATTIDNNVLVVQAGRHHVFTGGIQYYGLDPLTGSILWKKRSVLSSEGVYANPERGLVMYEKIANGEVPYLDPWKDFSSEAAPRKVNPKYRVSEKAITITIAAGKAVPYDVSLLSLDGRVLIKHSGYLSEELYIPTKRLRSGRYILDANIAGSTHHQSVTISRRNW